MSPPVARRGFAASVISVALWQKNEALVFFDHLWWNWTSLYKFWPEDDREAEEIKNKNK
jgi:hypothetical protein